MKKYEKAKMEVITLIVNEKISANGLSGWLEENGAEYSDARITTYAVQS